MRKFRFIVGRLGEVRCPLAYRKLLAIGRTPGGDLIYGVLSTCLHPCC